MLLWWSSYNGQQTPSRHVISSSALKNRMAGWGLTKREEGKNIVNIVCLWPFWLNLKTGVFICSIIRLTQLRSQIASPAPATCTCVVILPLNTTTCMTYLVFPWPLDWKTIKTTSALLSNWIRGKEQVSLVSFRLCLGYSVTAANHFPTP